MCKEWPYGVAGDARCTFIVPTKLPSVLSCVDLERGASQSIHGLYETSFAAGCLTVRPDKVISAQFWYPDGHPLSLFELQPQPWIVRAAAPKDNESLPAS